jgi:hypothetical protein
VKESRFFMDRRNYVSFELHRCYFANMYIMRRDLLDEYLTFCFEVLAICRARMALTGRALGYFSERVFSFWLCQKRIENPTLRVLELPFIFAMRRLMTRSRLRHWQARERCWRQRRAVTFEQLAEIERGLVTRNMVLHPPRRSPRWEHRT